MTRLNEISEQMMLQSKMLQVMLEEPPQHTAQPPPGVKDQERGVSGEEGRYHKESSSQFITLEIIPDNTSNLLA